jgi:drug/metabolite transporter (DMT)-like permease
VKRSQSTLLALAAIVIWSTLALAGAGLQNVPPFILLAVAFTVSGLVALVRWQAWRVPVKVIVVGVAGIFGYHFLYFRAFTHAPAVEVNLINYLWPLLIVALSPLLLPGYRLSWRHILGALLGLGGAVLIATGGRFSPQTRYLIGYLLAGATALTWALYSLLTKRLPRFPTETVGVFCLLSGLLAWAGHFASGGSLVDLGALTPGAWLALILVGLGPMGAAFYFWDAALKGGDPRTIGSLAYLTPLLSTLNLIVFGGQRLTWVTGSAMLLIVGGAVVGSQEDKTPALAEKN